MVSTMKYVGTDSIFATHIAKYSLPELIDEITPIHKDYITDESLWFANQSENCYLLNNHKELQQKLIDVAHDFLVKRLNYDCNVQMTTSWFTRTRNKDYQKNKHTHHNSWWSGVYYFQDECAIQFDNVLAQFSSIKVLPKDFSLNTTELATYRPKKGELLLFPSQTPHMVIKNENKKQYTHTRSSLAFNFMPKGKIGHYDSHWEF